MNHDPRSTFVRFGWAAGFGLVLAACGGGSPSAGDFVSDNPNGGGYGDEGGTGAGEDGGAGGEEGDSGGDDGGRAIAEADIIQIEGDRLYAISEFAGLSVIDVSDPTELPVLGRHRDPGRPFEMYVDGGQVFLMYNDFGSYEYDEEAGGWTWHRSSKLVALDASDPESIEVRGRFDLPGSIQDSRRVGDVLYVVTHQDGSCWGCETDVNTTITSLDISKPAQPRVVDELSFVTEVDDYFWGGRRSVSSTNERMYVAGVDYTENEDAQHSTIDVVDISDPSGTMVRGASIEVAGLIESRWQMDEFEGVLRVVSQPGWWNTDQPPEIQTFSVAAADDIVPLGSATMTLPRPESLQAVRFDGLRGYAITFEQTDPLFTLDLSDPAQPRQVGELEIPGWVYHIEPRGDRLLALGFDRGNPEGSINVSLFDVSQFDAPMLTKRVNFGGDWASFAEDQNRVHKAFTILDEQGLVLVPFSGWDHDDGSCYGKYISGIQLVDWAQDDLALRGVAPSYGQSRRAFLHRGHLFGVSDASVETFDISDRDAPALAARTPIAFLVDHVAPAGDVMVRYGRDWWTNTARLEVVPIDDPESAEPWGALDLEPVLEQEDGPECWEGGGYWAYDLVAREGYAYLFRRHYQWTEDSSKEWTALDVFDISDPTAPAFVQTVELPSLRDWGGGGTGDSIVSVGDAWLGVQQDWLWDEPSDEGRSRSKFVVIDLSDPEAPAVSRTIERTEGLEHGRPMVFGDQVVSWYMQSANESGSQVRYYLERLDLSNPAEPRFEPPINVPGRVAAYDAAANRAITIDTRVEVIETQDEQECWEHPKVFQWDYEAKRCVLVHRTPKLVRILEDGAALLDELDVEGDDARLEDIHASRSRVFARLTRGSHYGYGWAEDGGDGGYVPPTAEIAIVSGLSGDRMQEETRVDLRSSVGWFNSMVAHENWLLFSSNEGLGVLDATQEAAPELTMHEVYGYGCWELEVSGNQAFCPMSAYGLQSVTLP